MPLPPCCIVSLSFPLPNSACNRLIVEHERSLRYCPYPSKYSSPQGLLSVIGPGNSDHALVALSRNPQLPPAKALPTGVQVGGCRTVYRMDMGCGNVRAIPPQRQKSGRCGSLLTCRRIR